MDGAKIPLTFKIYKGDQLLRTETLRQPVIKVGKLPSNHLRIEDDLVSRMHAVIEVSGPNDVSIIDLGSTKGTVVNGQKVNKAKLQDGDVIVLGDTRIVVGVGAPEIEPVAAPSPKPPSGPSVNVEQVFASSPRPPASMGYGQMQHGAPRPTGPQVAAPQFGLDAAEDLGGARAIEVAAMLGDSVVAVKHLTNPRGGKVSTTTWALFALAAVCLVMSVFAFAHGIAVAQENKRLFQEWVDVRQKAPADFRPVRMSLGWDVMAFVGLGGALVLVTWAAARVLDERRSPYFRIGTAKEAEFPTADAPAAANDAFPLVAPQGDDFVFSWAQGMRGDLSVEGKVTPLETLPQTMPIPHKARIRVESGGNVFLVSSVPAPRRHTGMVLAALEGVVLAYFLGSTVAHLGFWVLLRAIPPDKKTTVFDTFGNDPRMNKAELKATEDPKKEEEKKKGDDKEAGGTGTRQAGEEGKMGKKDSDRKTGRYAMKNNNADPMLARQQQLAAVSQSGMLGAINASKGGAFASITGTGDFSSGLDDRDVFGGLMGDEVGEMAGGFGYGLQGTGGGGGGTGMGTIGLGRYGTIGHGSGTGTGYGVGSGSGSGGRRNPGVPPLKLGIANVQGDLDKAIIRRYIRQKLPQIEYCYQRQVTVNASLQGTVTTVFTINGNGQVISVSAKGMGNAEVESCVAGVIRSIQFPKPANNGFVNVTYPFNFHMSGTN